ncbi:MULTISPECIES: hypothetical protein [Haloferax]|uniref:Uncharacterized protein n=2 Tax=Haloferax gibbonsii TaxID=35746 RepID=A0A0K1IWG4_HALGI|nr:MULTISPECIES: hypothetical protein [Haloferax]AKU08769.1 hypothetical protein ABY42_13860 [Haloferax gibbonsii]ELZ81094.1 hypothetical protein C454_08621 [Haloferax gibbonsii ATCC 33959]QOS12055.1 uncharacterized protein HfgLR_09580 [Haloferax gibbonsii]RDZ52091.1 hypothetical protein C5C07_09865 [Haloferax sp. Atlit-4N]REA01231.1 hypothetical protein DEQ92_17930 [Haloferax sp. Atlit-6N]
MVGSSMSDEETRLANNRIKIGFVLLVGVSAGLVAVQAGATLVQSAIALLAGVAVGGVLTWYLGRWAKEFTAVNRR